MITPVLSKKALTSIAIAGLFIAVIGAVQFQHGRVYYPHVVVEIQNHAKLEFLQEGVPKDEDCQATTAAIADAIRVTCPTCRVATKQCPGKLEPEREKLFSEEPIAVPSSRMPHGVVIYISDDKDLALAACRETERMTVANQGFRAVCYPPNTTRPLPGPPKPQRFEAWQALAGFFVLLLTGFASAFTGYLIVRYEALHANWSYDPVKTGPQKFHATPTPRIGGLGVMAGLFASGAALLATEQGASGEQFGYLLFASLPAFLGGITEDLTKNASVLARLALTMLAAACGAWLLGAVLPRLDVLGLDALLKWTPFAIVFTIFAVGGIANAINNRACRAGLCFRASGRQFSLHVSARHDRRPVRLSDLELPEGEDLPWRWWRLSAWLLAGRTHGTARRPAPGSVALVPVTFVDLSDIRDALFHLPQDSPARSLSRTAGWSPLTHAHLQALGTYLGWLQGANRNYASK